MKITVLTLFEELFQNYLSQTILKRAIDKDIINYEILNIRNFATDKHKQVDDTPFGGGAGMVLKPEPFFNFFFKLKEENRKPYVIFMTPQGKKLNQNILNNLINKEDIVIISGRYEGLDQRVIDRYVDLELSIGDYVLTSGDLPSLVLIDSLTRQLEGVIKKESYTTDSFYNGLLGFPQYTKPAKLGRHPVPDVLLTGNHKDIMEFRKKESIKKTILNRPDLLEDAIKKDENILKFIKDKL